VRILQARVVFVIKRDAEAVQVEGQRLLRLRVSLAQLAVLREALDEVQDGVGRVAAVVPRK